MELLNIQSAQRLADMRFVASLFESRQVVDEPDKHVFRDDHNARLRCDVKGRAHHEGIENFHWESVRSDIS